MVSCWDEMHHAVGVSNWEYKYLHHVVVMASVGLSWQSGLAPNRSSIGWWLGMEAHDVAMLMVD